MCIRDRRQRLKYLDSLCESWKDKVSPTQLARVSEDRLLWQRMVANVVDDGAQQHDMTDMLLFITITSDELLSGKKVKVKVVICITHRRVYTPLMRFSSLTRTAGRTATTCSLQTQVAQRPARQP